jgi:hypothetical protein
MARLAIGISIGIVVAVVGMAALGLHAAQTETADDADLLAAAQEAGVDPTDLQGAMLTTGLPAREYLYATGELTRPKPPAPPGWPFAGPVAQRIFCIEAIESHHGAAMFNPQPWHGEHAQGYLGWLPSTAQRWGVQIGNRASEWDGAARMLAAGAGRQFYGVAAGLC